MKKRTKRILGGLLILGAIIFYPSGRYYILPNGNRVKESNLPALGYVFYQGYWYPKNAINQAGGFNFTKEDIQAAINTGKGIWSDIKNVMEQAKDLFSKVSFEASEGIGDFIIIPGSEGDV